MNYVINSNTYMCTFACVYGCYVCACEGSETHAHRETERVISSRCFLQKISFWQRSYNLLFDSKRSCKIIDIYIYICMYWWRFVVQRIIQVKQTFGRWTLYQKSAGDCTGLVSWLGSDSQGTVVKCCYLVDFASADAFIQFRAEILSNELYLPNLNIRWPFIKKFPHKFLCKYDGRNTQRLELKINQLIPSTMSTHNVDYWKIDFVSYLWERGWINISII